VARAPDGYDTYGLAERWLCATLEQIRFADDATDGTAL
jgi:hypothetical protein